MSSVWVFLTCLFVASVPATVMGMEVYLRELTIYQSHESHFLPDSPEVYLVCEDDRDPIMLRRVLEVNKKYEFAPEQIPATHLDENGCVLCTLKEFDLLDKDDTFGTMKICEEGFRTGFSEMRTYGEFSAKLECPLCKANYEAKRGTAVVTNHLHSQSDASDSGDPAKTHRHQGMSTGAAWLMSGMLFMAGLALGIASAVGFMRYKGHKEALRMRELNSVLSQTEIPFSALPGGREKSKNGTLKAGIATYLPVSTDEPAESP